MRNSLVGLLIAAGLAGASTAHAQSYSFTLLDSVVPDSTVPAVPYSISGNGMVIAGGDLRYQQGEQPFIWRKVGDQWVRSQLPAPEPGPGLPQNRGRGMALSFDGDVIGGMAGDSSALFRPNYGYPAIWTDVLSGQPQLQLLASTELGRGMCGGVTADGASAVWSSTPVLDEIPQTSLWEQGVNIVIAPAPGSPLTSASVFSFFAPQVVSADGSLIGLAGTEQNTGLRLAYVRDQGVIRQLEVQGSLAVADIGGPERLVRAISSDGTTIVGEGASGPTNFATTRAVTWSRSGAMTILPRISPSLPAPGAVWTTATDVSADGQVIVGSQYRILPFLGARWQLQEARALVWVNRLPRTLQSILTAQGVNLGGVIPVIITGISDDGRTLTGAGIASIASDSPIVSFVATILPPGVCDDIDFNRDGSRFDPTDINAFLSVFSEGPCIPAGANCRDIDFNNDGSLFDPCDIDSFLLVFSEGPCTICGS
jgi:hypothetical protein